jgi:hypothetical protein
MVHHIIVIFSASVVLTVLAVGCATRRTSTELNPAAPAAAVIASQLSGTWRGELWPVGTDSTSVLNRDVTLEIRDDATYRLSLARQGTASNDSGVAALDGDAVILQSSSGQRLRLVRNGDRLYGTVNSSGRSMHIMVERAR